jgi:hypothetical protein
MTTITKRQWRLNRLDWQADREDTPIPFEPVPDDAPQVDFPCATDDNGIIRALRMQVEQLQADKLRMLFHIENIQTENRQLRDSIGWYEERLNEGGAK